MNVLLVSTKVRGAASNYCEKALKKQNNVEYFDLMTTPNFITRYINFLLPQGKPISIINVLKKCRNKPDLIIEVDGLDKHHLMDYKKIDIPTVYWAIDPHWKLKFQKLIAPDFDYIFVAQKDYIKYFKEISEKVFWLPLAADPDIHKKYEVPKIFDIGFVGQKDSETFPERAGLLNSLSKKYSVLAVDNIWEENIGKVYSLSKIGFNKSGKQDLNMRVFEIMSSGTMLLTDRASNGLSELFQDKKHLKVYDKDNLDEIIEYYLKNNEEREKIAKEGQREVLQKHTYEHRMREIIKKVVKNTNNFNKKIS